ncbi:MAG: RNA-directed DNA polymerase [Vicinamibacterales bacterium]
MYDWLQTAGFYPESYVLPPCFAVVKHRPFGKALTSHTKSKYKPPLHELLSVQFPRSDWTDRVFGIVHPDLHTDIALLIARNWKSILNALFDPGCRVFSYSFPIPVDRRSPGVMGPLRAGRMIYEWTEMAERDLAAEAFRYRCLFTADVKNCYAAIYTHSIAWALHGKRLARKRRNDFLLAGNRLDKLFQNANDSCTNGIPVGPAVSDLVSELVLSGVDRLLSKALVKAGLADKVLVVRFKDDYRILSKRPDEGRSALKFLQSALREFRLELNEDKTEPRQLPDGMFRTWVSLYHAANPNPKRRYDYRRFREVYLSVVTIDRAHPGTGVIDRFLADLVRRDKQLRLFLRRRELDQALSLLLMLPTLRAKAMPKVLAIVEALLRQHPTNVKKQLIGKHVGEWYDELAQKEAENVYQMVWLGYFMKANGLAGYLSAKKPKDPIARAPRTSRFSALGKSTQSHLFRGVIAAAKAGSMLQHLDIFDRTP